MDDEVIGADELEEAMSELGISGVDEIIGAAKRKARLKRRKIAGPSDSGRERSFAVLLDRSVALGAGVADTLDGRANRRALLKALVLSPNVTGLNLTGVQINGRNAVIGAGFCPAQALAIWAQYPELGLNFGVIDQGGDALVNVVNNTIAAMDVAGSFLGETTD